MARFYAQIQGQRGAATRLGSFKSGIYGHIRGWSLGIKVNDSQAEPGGPDRFDVYITGGSNGQYESALAFTVERSYTGELTLTNINRKLFE